MAAICLALSTSNEITLPKAGHRLSMSPPRKNIRLSGTPFCEILQRLREERQLTKAELADRAGLTSRTVHDLETGKRECAQEKTLIALATSLDVTVADLLGRNDEAGGDGDYPEASDCDRRPLISRHMGIALLASLLLVLALVWWNLWRFSCRHAEYDLESHRLIAHDAIFGAEIWSLQSTDRLMFCEPAPWHDEELLIGLGSETRNGGRLLNLERASGDTLWVMAPDLDEVVAAFGEQDVRAANFSCTDFKPFGTGADGAPQIVVRFTHGLYYPALVCRVDRAGRRLNQYANKGHLYGLQEIDLGDDGEPELLVTGTNNAKAYQGATVMLLDREHWAGASIDEQCNPESQVPDSARVRLVLPQFPPPYMQHLGSIRLQATNPQIHHSPDGDVLISVSVAASATATVIVYLDGELRPLGCDLTDGFASEIRRTWPDSLAVGTGPLDPAWLAEWLAGARRFEAGHRPPVGSGSGFGADR